MDLKKGAAEGIIKCFEPVNEYFSNKPENLDKMMEILKDLGKL